MQYSCHHIDTIRHPNSSYVTTKLYGTSTCGSNNNTIFSERHIFTFSYRRRMPGTLTWQLQSLGDSCQPKWKDVDTIEFIIFRIKFFFLPKYRVKYYDDVVKWCSGIYSVLVCIAGYNYCLNFSFKQTLQSTPTSGRHGATRSAEAAWAPRAY